MKEHIDLLIEEVKKKRMGQVGTLLGSPGEGIFLYNAYSILKDESLKQVAYAKLETAIEIIGKEAPVPKSYYSGIAGLGWAVHFLHKHHWLQEDVDDLLSDFDQLLSSSVDEYLIYRNWDLLHGACGLGIYFAARPVENPAACQNIHKILYYSLINLCFFTTFGKTFLELC